MGESYDSHGRLAEPEDGGDTLVRNASLPLRATLRMAGILYSGLVRLRHGLYGGGLIKGERASVPVICVGNLTLGGTGKTPMVEYVVRQLAAMGMKPGIASRGYGRATPSRTLVPVSDGKRLMCGAADCGDEPYLLATMLPGVPVAVCSRRIEACSWLADAAGCDCIVLDDGFQHLRLAREVDIVLVDARYDLRRMHMFPRGTLRERPDGLRRAGVVIHTKGGGTSDFTETNTKTCAAINPGLLQMSARFEPDSLVPLEAWRRGAQDGSPPPPAGTRVMAFAGIAHPEPFFLALEAMGYTVCRHGFGDHAEYGPESMQFLQKLAEVDNCPCMVTTAKDAVKLPQGEWDSRIHVLTQGTTVTREDELRSYFAAVLDAYRKRSRNT